MFRIANVVMVGALLVTAAVVYQLKYASTAEAERLASLRSQIRKERETIAVLKAEWARRTSPVFVQGLVERHLDLKRLDVDSFSNLNDLPAKPIGSDDGIGGIIEALVDAPLVTSSTRSTPAPTPVPASGGSGASVPSASALRPAGASVKPAAAPAPRPTPRPGPPQAQMSPPQAQLAPPQTYAPPPAAYRPPPAAAPNPLAPLLPPGSLPR